MTVLGVLGGSGLYEMAGLKNAAWHRIASPFGETSDEFLFGVLDGLDVVFAHCRDVFGIVSQTKQGAVNLRMQRLDPAIHHFGKAGNVGNITHLDSGVAERFRGAAGADDFNVKAL